MDISSADSLAALERYLGSVFSSENISIVGCKKLSGGAIQENWLIDVKIDGVIKKFVLRTDSPSSVAVSHSRPNEFQLIKAAYETGVTVPKPVALCEDLSVIARPFYLMEYVTGSAIGSQVVKERYYNGDMEALTKHLGQEMAAIHKITPKTHRFDFLENPSANPGLHETRRFQGYLDDLGLARPVLELGLRYLERIALPWNSPVLVHHDFRTGNYMVDETGLTAILDWEFSGWSDPHEDMGWFFAMCWRFGMREKPAGGVGSRASFYEGYIEVSDLKIDEERVRFWEIFAHIRWGVIALQQADRHIAGNEDNLNLALTGRMLPEMEFEILSMISAQKYSFTDSKLMTQDEPVASNLLTTAATILKDKILPDLEGDAKFSMLMALNAINIAGREISTVNDLVDMTSLCYDIRQGSYDDDKCLNELCSTLMADVIGRLEISNPSYIKSACNATNVSKIA